MALIIEDGSIVDGANSFVSVAQTDAWFAALDDQDWAALPPEAKERHIILGAAYVVNAQVYAYDGERVSIAQWLAWPRSGATYGSSSLTVPDDAIPNEIVRANMVAAGLSMKGQLPTSAAPPDPTGREVKKEKVDVIETEYFHSTEGQASGQQARGAFGEDAVLRYGHPEVTGIVAPLLADAVFEDGAGVPRHLASRRGVSWLGTGAPSAFHRGMFDVAPLSEDRINRDRSASGAGKA